MYVPLYKTGLQQYEQLADNFTRVVGADVWNNVTLLSNFILSDVFSSREKLFHLTPTSNKSSMMIEVKPYFFNLCGVMETTKYVKDLSIFHCLKCEKKPAFVFQVFLLTCSDVSYIPQPFQMSGVCCRLW